MWKPDAYIEECDYIVIASWHQGDSVDFYGPTANGYAQCLYDIVSEYLTELLDLDMVDSVEVGMINDFLSNRNKYSTTDYIETALGFWGNPDILTLKVLDADGLVEVWSWGGDYK